jgi:hypothetical protein
MSDDTRSAFLRSLSEAPAAPDTTVPGVPATEYDCAAALWSVQERLRRAHGGHLGRDGCEHTEPELAVNFGPWDD